MNEPVETPWGSYQVTHTDELYQVKTIKICPNQAPSYQYHYKRKEIWVILAGKGELKLNDKLLDVTVGDVITIGFEDKHQMKNVGDEDLVFTEIQVGSYFGEDDIVRIDDLYGRN